MARAKYQVLIIPFTIMNEQIKYAVFHRSDMDAWQFIAGGGEEGETYLDAAKREALEEANISYDNSYYCLETCCSIPSDCFPKAKAVWGNNCFVIPEYVFAVKIIDYNIKLSNEHLEYQWLDYDEAKSKLQYDSNKTALWELDSKIKMNLIR